MNIRAPGRTPHVSQRPLPATRPPASSRPPDVFSAPPARPPVVLTAPTAPQAPAAPLPTLSDGEARSRLDGALAQRLATIEDRFRLAANPRTPLDRLNPAGRRELSQARDAIVAGQKDPSGAGGIRAAVELMRREMTLNRYAGRIAFDSRFEAATDQLMAGITPERIARDGYAATLNQVVADVRRLANEVLGPQALAFPTRIETALGGG